jgi:1,4-dihydroxy-2-naphthoate octaprenyltransferase
MLIVFFALPAFMKIYPIFLKPKPERQPEGARGWPLYFVGYAFYNNRRFGSLFMLGLLVDVLLRIFMPAFWV